MTREEFIKQRCEIDKITEEEFEKQYRVVKCDCGQPYCKGYRCLDLDGLLRDNQELREKLDKYENPEDMTLMMMWCTEKVKDENEKLKKQLHEASITIQEMVEQDIECPSNCEKLRILKKQHEKLLNDYCRLDARKYSEQKEFIKYMNSCIKELEKESPNKLQNTINLGIIDITKTILQKYRSIIGENDV